MNRIGKERMFLIKHALIIYVISAAKWGVQRIGVARTREQMHLQCLHPQRRNETQELGGNYSLRMRYLSLRININFYWGIKIKKGNAE